MDQPPLRISLRWMLYNLVGALLTAGGVWMLLQAVNLVLGGMMLLVGMALMGLSLLQILRRARRAATRKPS